MFIISRTVKLVCAKMVMVSSKSNRRILGMYVEYFIYYLKTGQGLFLKRQHVSFLYNKLSGGSDHESKAVYEFRST